MFSCENIKLFPIPARRHRRHFDVVVLLLQRGGLPGTLARLPLYFILPAFLTAPFNRESGYVPEYRVFAMDITDNTT